MILLDTNVISEPTKPLPHPGVTAWLNRQVPETLYLATTSLSELLLGIELLPAGRRKQGLSENMDGLIRRYFEERILAFDRDAAIACASIVARASRQGYAIATPDGQIAAIAAVHGLTVATRDVAPFAAAGVPVLNPWEI
jgi:predicted nucleic acid-binding protein